MKDGQENPSVACSGGAPGGRSWGRQASGQRLDWLAESAARGGTGQLAWRGLYWKVRGRSVGTFGVQGDSEISIKWNYLEGP